MWKIFFFNFQISFSSYSLDIWRGREWPRSSRGRWFQRFAQAAKNYLCEAKQTRSCVHLKFHAKRTWLEYHLFNKLHFTLCYKFDICADFKTVRLWLSLKWFRFPHRMLRLEPRWRYLAIVDLNSSPAEADFLTRIVNWGVVGRRACCRLVNVSIWKSRELKILNTIFCLAIYCSPVPQIANGFAISATNVSFGGMAKYGCYEGFSFASGKKSEEIFCTDEGRWTGTPQCRGLRRNFNQQV